MFTIDEHHVTRASIREIDITLLANDSLCYTVLSSRLERRVHYEESCLLDRPADNLRDIPVISRVPDALLTLVPSPTVEDRQFGIASMPDAACSIGKRAVGFCTSLFSPKAKSTLLLYFYRRDETFERKIEI